MSFRKTYTPSQALEKAKHFCGYQERSHAQVKEKLYGWGLRKAEVEEILSKLIEEDYLNEERFATAFAGGKFRIKQWGKVKIAHALKQQQVSAYNLQIAMREVDPDTYQKTLEKVARKKWTSLQGKRLTPLHRQLKTRAYLLQRGYEPAIVQEILARISADAGKETGD
jgi:regulatory protein